MRIRQVVALAAVLVSAIGLGRLEAKDDPVQWTLEPYQGVSNLKPGSQAWLQLTATIQDGWHLYSPTTPPGGPIITSLRVVDNPAFSSVAIFRPQPISKLDPNFNLQTETYGEKTVFLIDATLAPSAKGMTNVQVAVRYQACTDVKCLPPVKKTAEAAITVDPSGASPQVSLPSGYASVPQSTPAVTPTTSSSAAPAPQGATGFSSSAAQQDLLPFLLTAFGFGLAALFTPCVFPMIPITVSFFLNQPSSQTTGGAKKSGWVQALIFCFGIVVLFTGLGFLATLIAGPFGVVQLGSSPWVNGFISLVFFVFGLSLLGAFELRLPSGLLTRMDRASQGGGIAGTLVMGLTFSLTSFACIGPIVGPLLVASVQSKGLQPVLGMASFATGLATPFFLLALFPSYLKRLPRSGGWMVRIKMVLGFIVLAAMLKYLSNVDAVLQWHFFTRERVIAGWVVLFALPGLYLLGVLRMDGMTKEEPVTVLRSLLASCFLIFAIGLTPGLFGARLGELDAYLPEPSGSLFAGQGGAVATTQLKNDLDGALRQARAENKLVLINFTGYACTNCHWMKANIFPRPEIQAALKEIVIVDLYTDGTDAQSEQNQKLEENRFNTVSIPFYALLDPEQNVIATFPQLTRNPQEFLAFLESKSRSKA